MTGLFKVCLEKFHSSTQTTDVYSETNLKLKRYGLLVYTKDIALSQTLYDLYSFPYSFPYSKVYTIDSFDE